MNQKFYKQRWLWLLVGLKVLAAGFFTSGYKEQLFVPFITHFITTFENPWASYLASGGSLDAFPYHPLMLYSLSLAYLPVVWLGIDSIFIQNILFKAPLVLADLLIFYLLLKSYPRKKLAVVGYYLANPIIFYAIYLHSQLDILPIAFLFLAVFLVEKGRYTVSALALGAAFAFKSQVILVLPFLLIYLYKKRLNLKNIGQYLIFSLGLFGFLVSPYILSKGYLLMVLANMRQSSILDSYVMLGTAKVYLIVVMLILIYARFLMFRKINRDMLFAMIGALFILLIILIKPSPAWMVWNVPFVCFYFIKAHYKDQRIILFYLSTVAAYGLYFLFFHQAEYQDLIFWASVVDLKIVNVTLTNLALSLFEATLIGLLYVMIKFALHSNSIYAKQENTLIGIGGDSGSGKTTMLGLLDSLFSQKIVKLEGDGDHKWERGAKDWDEVTHLNPKANYIHRQAQDLIALKHGRSVTRTDYDHDSGNFVAGIEVRSEKLIVLSGLHPFFLPKMRKITDLKIFLDTDEDLRCYWKYNRDTKERSYSLEQVKAQMQERKADREKYILPQRDFADLVIGFFPKNTFDPLTETPEIGLKITTGANINLEGLVAKADDAKVAIEWDYSGDGHHQHLVFEIEPKAIDFGSWGTQLVPNIEELTGPSPSWNNGFNGLIQLVILMILSSQMAEENALETI